MAYFAHQRRETTFEGVAVSALSQAFAFFRAYRNVKPFAHDRYRRVFNWYAVRYCDDPKMLGAADRIDRSR